MDEIAHVCIRAFLELNADLAEGFVMPSGQTLLDFCEPFVRSHDGSYRAFARIIDALMVKNTRVHFIFDEHNELYNKPPAELNFCSQILSDPAKTNFFYQMTRWTLMLNWVSRI